MTVIGSAKYIWRVVKYLNNFGSGRHVTPTRERKMKAGCGKRNTVKGGQVTNTKTLNDTYIVKCHQTPPH